MEIPAKYECTKTESKILDFWLAKGVFNSDIDPARKPFSIVIPPPNVTGILHMGHALNNTIQDVLIRYKRMQGAQTLWMPGTDHAGIATQNVVEKNLAKEKIRKEDIGREKFLEKLWEWTDQRGSTILQQLKRLGASCEWRRTRFTMDEAYSESIKEVFIKLYDKGLIYRGKYIINWCPRCKTALSDEESPHREIDGWLYYLKYPVVYPKDQTATAGDYIVVATTRPETMLGDTAVAVIPDDERYHRLKNAKVILPIVDRHLRVVEDEAVDPAFGTGVVKVTPAHDPVDFTMGKKHNLEFINIMHDDARLNENVPEEFIGMDRFEARAAILEVLQQNNLIEKKEPYKVSAGHCYRCHTIIEPRISPQWFVKMKPLAEPAIKVVEEDKIKFYPPRWKKVYLNWMYNIQDWCISRQIWWGHQIPAWYCKDCRQKDPDGNKGVIVAKSKPEQCPDCGCQELDRDQDVLDTWFSSWLWPFATFFWPFTPVKMHDSPLTADKDIWSRDVETLKKELAYYYPTTVLVTASEILFFWVARMIMAGIEFKGEPPFKDVIIHGTVRDASGVKMSKSLGNVIDPLQVIEKIGSDALRFSMMLVAASGSDVYLSDEKFMVGRNFSNKVWNAARFLLMRVNEANIDISDLDLKQRDAIDDWLLENLNQSIEQVNRYLDEYAINEATRVIYDFFWHTFCDWYIEVVKDKFTPDRAKVLVYALLNSLKLLHPLMPFITEEIFGLVRGCTSLKLEESIVYASWPVKYQFTCDRDKVKELEMIFSTIKEVRNIKSDLGLSSRKLDMRVKVLPKYRKLWEDNRDWIVRLASLSGVVFCDSVRRVLYKNGCWELDLQIEIADMQAFLASLDKKIASLQGAVDNTARKMQNEKFLTNAPAELIAIEKAKAQEWATQMNRLKELRGAF